MSGDLDLGVTKYDQRTHPLTYDPRPPFDIDTRPIPGGRLRRWRKKQPARPGKRDCPGSRDYATISTISEAFGISYTSWAKWESEGIQAPGWAAMVREWALSGCDLEVTVDRASKYQVRALIQLMGGIDPLADGIGKSRAAVAQWSKTKSFRNRPDGAPVGGGSGPLIHFLFAELDLEEVEKIDRRYVPSRSVLEAQQVREIRRRADADEPITDIAKDYPGISYGVVYDAARRNTYQHIGGDDDE